MAKLLNRVQSQTEKASDLYLNSSVNRVVGNVSSVTKDAVNIASNALLLTLSKAWIGLSTVDSTKRAVQRLQEQTISKTGASSDAVQKIRSNSLKTETGYLNRFDYEKLFSLQLGEIFMPVSQTFTLNAEKIVNTSSLVDGIDIIQQVRKKAKTIDCSIRISLNKDEANREVNGITFKSVPQYNLKFADAQGEVMYLSEVLQTLWENDTVFEVSNDEINNTHRVTHAIMTKYKFTPRVGMNTYTFEFTLMEVKYGDNVLTFDLSEVNANVERQIIN